MTSILHLILVITIFSTVPFVNSSQKLPSFIKVCHRDDPRVNDCILKEARRIQKTFVRGIPALNVEPIDPLRLGKMVVLPPTHRVQLSHENAIMKGFRHAKIVDLKVNFNNKTGTIRITGNCTMVSDYTIKGTLLVFPIEGKGRALMKMRNYDITLNWKWDLVKGKDGQNYLKIIDFDHTYDLENAYIKLNNLFNGNKQSGDTMNRFINNNWKDIMKEIGPPSMKIVQKKVINIFNEFYSKIPFDELLPLSRQRQRNSSRSFFNYFNK